MANYVRDEDGVWGQECKLVLYDEGMPQTAENRHLLTHKILVVLDKEVASMELLQQLASAVGVEVGSEKIGNSGSAWLLATCGGSALKAAEILRSHESVIKARPIITNFVVKMVGNGPNDQFFNPSDQYYLHPNNVQNINVLPVWCGDDPLQQRYFGRNVLVSILDDGVQGEHPELDRNYQYGRDTDFVDGDNDGAPVGDDDHGTAMAGIIGGRQNNGVGITGVAPATELFSTRVFGVGGDPQIFSDAIEHERSTVDVIVLGFVSGGNYVDLTELVEDSFFEMAERKDVPICYPAGSAGGIARIDYDRAASHRYTIATAAEDVESEPGASLIATAPGVQLVTTDLMGEDGEEPGDYQFNFSGTSGAAAQTTGVVSLMQEARPDLGWRDYQEILLLSGAAFDVTFFENEAATETPFGAIPFKYSYLWGGGRLDAFTAVALAEIWARLPDTATEYRVADQDLSNSRTDIGVVDSDDFDVYFGDANGDGQIDRLLPPRTFLFDFNKTVSREQNLRIEHVEVRIEWEEDENGGNARLLPVYAFLVDPYYTNGPGNPNVDNTDNRPLPAPVTSNRTAHGSLLAGDVDDAGNVTISLNTPRVWTYTTVRHWGLINTLGEDRIGVPDWENRVGEDEEDITPAGVWELDLSVNPFLIDDNPDNPSSILSRRLLDVDIIMYGTENNQPPSVIGADISSSGNPDVLGPRTAFADEDLIVNNVELYDFEGDPIGINYRWQVLGEDGLTWTDLFVSGFEPSGCQFDQLISIEASRDIGGNTLGRYFLIYPPDGTEVAVYFQPPFSVEDPPAAVTNADQIILVNGVVANEGANGIAADIAAALDGAGFEVSPGVQEGEVLVTFPIRSGGLPAPDQGTSNYKIQLRTNPGPILGPGEPRTEGNCFGNTTARLDESFTIGGNKYRAIMTPRQGLREGFLFISDEIIVNSRPITEAVAFTPYFYDADLWILTVPPEDLAPFAFINEVSQGTGDTTTNREWIELLVNFSTDLRGYKVGNDIAGFDVTFTDSIIWEEVEFGTLITIYNGGQKDPLIPPDTPIEDIRNVTTKNWIISSDNPELFILPNNGDGWGELSNRNCFDPNSGCDGASISLSTNFNARSPVHGVSFNGNGNFVNVGFVPARSSAYYNGQTLENFISTPNDPDAWVMDLFDPDFPAITGAINATPAAVNSGNNQTILDTIIAEGKTSIPTYRFYPGDGTQALLEAGTGNRLFQVIDDPDNPGFQIEVIAPDLVASDFVPGLSIDRRSGVISGIPNVPDGGVFTIKVQRSHSFSSEIQIYELNIEAAPPLVDTDDEDNDGLINLLEEALVGNPFEAEANILPLVQVVDSGGMDYLALSFRRLKGGVFDMTAQTYTVDDLVYSIEASTDLQTWLTAPDVMLIDEGAVDVADNPLAEIATFRVLDAFGSAAIQQDYFLRLRVTRLP